MHTRASHSCFRTKPRWVWFAFPRVGWNYQFQDVEVTTLNNIKGLQYLKPHGRREPPELLRKRNYQYTQRAR
eukprot:4788925-Lingulodinium_polyedra.AAC.1